jgi:hypothetical protein
MEKGSGRTVFRMIALWVSNAIRIGDRWWQDGTALCLDAEPSKMQHGQSRRWLSRFEPNARYGRKQSRKRMVESSMIANEQANLGIRLIDYLVRQIPVHVQ